MYCKQSWQKQKRFFLEVSKPLGWVPKLDSSHWQKVQALENYLLLLPGPFEITEVYPECSPEVTYERHGAL